MTPVALTFLNVSSSDFQVITYGTTPHTGDFVRLQPVFREGYQYSVRPG